MKEHEGSCCEREIFRLVCCSTNLSVCR